PRLILARSHPLVQAVEALAPESPVRLEPVGGVLQRRRAQPRGTKLGRACPLDQAGALEHPEVLRDRLDADRKRLRQLVDRRLAVGQPCEDRAARRIREGGEGGGELVGGHYSPARLNNWLVEYSGTRASRRRAASQPSGQGEKR